MYALHRRAYPKDIIVGWYATSNDINNLSALMHSFYINLEGVAPHPPIHMTVPTYTGSESGDLTVNTFISSPIGSAENAYLFVPIPNEIKYSEAETAGLVSFAKAQDKPDRSVTLVSDIRILESSVVEVIEMLDRVSTYVSNVITGKSQGSVAIGKFLLKNLSLVPSVSPENLEKMFNSHLQDVLMVVYLANTVKTQLQLTSKLTPLV